MKLRVSPRPLLSRPNLNRAISSDTLYRKRRDSFLIRRTHLPRRKLRMANPQHTRQRRFFLLHLPLPTHCTRPILRLLLIHRDLKHWSCTIPFSNNDRLRRLRPPLRTNIVLRRHCHHKLNVCRTLRRQHPSPMDLRGLFS